MKPLAATADLKAVEVMVRSAGTSFYRGMRVLPPDRRYAMYAIYAFCRIVDDIADEDMTFEKKDLALLEWRTRISALYRGVATDELTRVLLAAIRRYHLREADFRAIIEGMAMDARKDIVAPDMDFLDLYCDRVAAAVGRLSVRVFGDFSADADRVAYHLGRALQLTNILRDLREDAARNRLYLPREWLQEAGVPLEPLAALASPSLGRVCERLAGLARQHFGHAWAAMRRCKRKEMKPARLMGATYAALLSRIESQGWVPQPPRASLPKWQKLWIALRFGLF